jgi:predicted small lipoprotein YifL
MFGAPSVGSWPCVTIFPFHRFFNAFVMHRLLLILMAFALLAACGTKGPLYLPKPAPAAPATAAKDTNKAAGEKPQ